MKNFFIKNNLICPLQFNKSSGKVEDALTKQSKSEITFKNQTYNIVENVIETFFEDNLANIPKEWKIFKKIFDKKNIARKDCLLLPFKAVSKALKL